VAWLKTVGKNIFGIRHFWLRYEFAPSRGQIHAHIIAISDDHAIQYKLHALKGNDAAQAQVLADWAASKFRLTARHPSTVADPLVTNDTHPCGMYFSDVIDKNQDAVLLMELLEMHGCSSYCLRDTTKEEKLNWCKKRGCEK
jgi:hypothetical protein